MAAYTITIKCRWWVGPLGTLLLAVYRLTGWKPDADRLVSFIGRRGIYVAKS